MYKALLIITACLLVRCSSSTTTSMNSENNAAAKEEGFISLVEGNDLKGWHSYGKTSAGKVWTNENGVLHIDQAIKKQSPSEGGDLVTDEEYENFDLKLEWKISPQGNSGIIFYVHEEPSQYPDTYN